MLKLYKNFRPIDWALTALIAALTVAQVFFTMCLTDQISAIVGAIQAVSLHLPGASTGDIWRSSSMIAV